MGKTGLGWLLSAVLALMVVASPVVALAQARGSIGVRVHDVTTGTGAAIDEVLSGTPAERAGLKAGDVVVEFDGERVRGVQHFTRLVQETPPGRQVAAVVQRNGERQTVQVTVEQQRGAFPELQLRDDLRALPGDRLFEMPLPRIRPDGGRTGTTLLPLNDQLASYFGVQTGVLVSFVDPGSAAARAGLKAGDVITAVNGRVVRDPAEVRRAMRGAEDSALELQIMRDHKQSTLRIPGTNQPG